MFPVVKYALMLGGRRADDDPEGDDGDGDPERDDPERDEESLGTGAAPAEVHVILPPSRPAERAPSARRETTPERTRVFVRPGGKKIARYTRTMG